MIIVCIIHKNSEDNQLRNGGHLSTASINGFSTDRDRNLYVEYEFTHNGKRYLGSSLSHVRYIYRDKLLDKTYPVLFSVSDPETNEILLTPFDFKDYNYTFPDSLNWVKALM